MMVVEKFPGNTASSGRAVLSSLLSHFSPPLAHCLDPDRKSGRPGPESERKLFLLLCDCFLFILVAILHDPGGPVLIRVPTCSRAVPEGCVAIESRAEREKGGARGSHTGVEVHVCVWRVSNPR